MRVIDTKIPDVKLLEPQVFGDERGFFMETFRDEWFKENVVDRTFVQENHSKSVKGVLRGLHYQTENTQGKLVRVVSGAVFDVAVDMVDQCPALKKRIKPVMSVKRLVYKPTNSFYQVLSAEAYTKHGLNVHAVIFDELHAQPNRELFDVMTKGSGDARTQPLYFLITTAGTDRISICFEQHQKAVDIIEGRNIDPTFYPVIYGASDEDDWTSEATWYKANPSLGETIDIEKVRNAYISAKENVAEENIFRQLRLNQWVKQSTRWMQMDKWNACAFFVNEEELIGRTCYGGLDLSSTLDITAFVLVFPPRNDEEFMYRNKNCIFLPTF